MPTLLTCTGDGCPEVLEVPESDYVLALAYASRAGWKKRGCPERGIRVYCGTCAPPTVREARKRST